MGERLLPSRLREGAFSFLPSRLREGSGEGLSTQSNAKCP